ncbi:MAG: HAMP domain-containing sensor histidine kinase [Myxococcota bacterium]
MTKTSSSLEPQSSASFRDQLPRRVAHTLRTPLGLVDAALRELGATMGDEPMLVLGNRGVRQIARLADRLSLLGRLEQAECIERQPVDLSPLVDRALHDIVETRPRKRVRVTRGPIPAPALISGDGTLVRAALAELVDNAVRFARRSVEVGAYEHDGQMVIEVRDDGPGPTKVTASEAGLGIGFYLVGTIVSLHAGRFELQDDDGGGGLASLVLGLAT